jgi:hypothetical protein
MRSHVGGLPWGLLLSSLTGVIKKANSNLLKLE